ncbi:MAG: preprotein translocase subunit SecA [Candidatus Komeilibacteria bacterium]|jgi:preprotein translocase subunit SecA|nr:preprotein translocase subunit SecA [Candidatus Komeilibacteria bacterium]MBT4447670.1 preprotein translocase subunit SecA [Candidatus Komeilibacteria bacterium]
MLKFLDKLFGDANEKFLKSLQPQVDAINEKEKEFLKLNDDELKKESLNLKKQIQDGTKLDDVLVPAFALIKVAAQRTLGQRHYNVQILGGIVLHQGQIAEMKTGEGKTLTSTLAVYLNALSDKGVHVITVNDYLAKRDAVWMAKVYDFLGISIGVIAHDSAFVYDTSEDDSLRPVERKEAYQADITYGTNNEFGFDYLRDNMTQDSEKQVQRGLHYTLIDEVDSVLIDEARTPLIISAPADQSTDRYGQFAQMIQTLKENEDYNIDEKMKACTLTEEGVSKMEKSLGVDNIYESHGMESVHHIESALKAKTLFSKDRDYVIQDNEVIIIDEFTGRMMPGRRYSEGLHQAIEAKEGVEIQKESMTLATVTFQNYFRMYKKLGGMTGTAATEAEEMAKIYNLDVTVIPTNKAFSRDDQGDKIYKSYRGKLKAIVREIQERHDKGQPVLVGTISIDKNEELGKLLEKAGIPHNLLNAKFHEKEAEIISQAGRKGAVTVATNMAGRGVDIILGGSPMDKAKCDEIIELGGLHVLGTERHESRRIDNQLRGRAGRQGDIGSSQFYISMEDDLMRIFGSDRMKNMMDKLGIAEDMPIENKLISNSIESAQKKVEGHNFDIRKHLVEYDDVINKHRQVVYGSRQQLLEIFSDKEHKTEKSSQDIVLEYVDQEIESVVSFHTLGEKNTGDFDPKEILETLKSIFVLESEEEIKIKELLTQNGKSNSHDNRDKVIEYINSIAKNKYLALTEDINANVDLQDDTWKPMQIIERSIVLKSIDTLWVEHLTAMDKLRTGIGLQGYGQKDPLIEYKREAFNLFNQLLEAIRKQIVYSIFKVNLKRNTVASGPKPGESQKVFEEQKQGYQPFQKQVANRSQANPAVSNKPIDETGKRIGRNDPCYCGSGKKYKKCHGK